MKSLNGIRVKKENGFFKVPADFQSGFNLVPEPNGRMNLVFCNINRMKRYLRNYGYMPSLEGPKL